MAMRVRVLWFLAITACGGGGSRESFTDDNPASPALSGTTDQAPAPLPSGRPPASSGDDCDEATKKIYVITLARELFRFDPPTKTFEPVGTGPLTCATSATAHSMAVDRKGTAWVLFEDGSLHRVSTKDASCTSTTYATGQSGIRTFGMGFASDAAGSSAESLWIAADGGAIGRLETTTLTITQTGSAFPRSELTGTQDARLFAFVEQPPQVAEVDRTTSKIIQSAPVSMQIIGGFAFAQWGGDFYMFTQSGFDGGGAVAVQFDFTKRAIVDTVTRPSPSSAIVGAGVSTCAPTAPPH